MIIQITSQRPAIVDMSTLTSWSWTVYFKSSSASPQPSSLSLPFGSPGTPLEASLRFVPHNRNCRSFPDAPPAHNVQSQSTGDDRLPYYHYHESPEGRFLWTRRTAFVEDTFGSFAMTDLAHHPPTAQQPGQIMGPDLHTG
jgi:hypothetical protein